MEYGRILLRHVLAPFQPSVLRGRGLFPQSPIPLRIALLAFFCILCLPHISFAQGAVVSGPAPEAQESPQCEQRLSAAKEEIAVLRHVERLIDGPRAQQDKRTLVKLGLQIDKDVKRIAGLENEVAQLKKQLEAQKEATCTDSLP